MVTDKVRNYIDIEKYIKQTREQRMFHLNLNEKCIEIGGYSSFFKGLLAHFLITTIPKGKKIFVCHACHNDKCSNVNHLYWGTPSDNSIDSYINGRKSIYQSMIDKYGIKKTKQLQRVAALKGSKISGEKSKFKDNEVQERLQLIKNIDLTKFGWIQKVSDVLKISHTQSRRFIQKYYSGKTYKRNS